MHRGLLSPTVHSWPSWTVVKGSLGTTSCLSLAQSRCQGLQDLPSTPIRPAYPSPLALTLAPQWQGVHLQPALICSVRTCPVSHNWETVA